MDESDLEILMQLIAVAIKEFMDLEILDIIYKFRLYDIR